MKLRHVNDILLCLIVLVNMYVIGAPLLPYASQQWQGRGDKRLTQLTAVVHTKPQTNATVSSGQTATENSVIIPKLLLNEPIVEGPADTAFDNLYKGVWRWPGGSTPDKGGNTVILGHRFAYTHPKGVFYFLNRLTIGDEVAMTWNNKRYIYKVSDTRVVPPTDTSILAPTTDNRLTIYTCTPLWRPTDRLVVTAELEQTL